MTLNQLETLKNMSLENNLITAKNLQNLSDRTLIYGYTCERKTFHVYLKNKEIHTVVYETSYRNEKKSPVNMRELIVRINESYIPDKRIYPEACDYEFCILLQGKDIYLPFTVYTEREKDDKYWGFTLED